MPAAMGRPLAPLLVLVVAPVLAGCTLFDVPAVPPDDRLVREVHAVDLAFRLDSPFGNVRATGPALAVPLRLDGVERGAVYLGPEVGWRADMVFDIRQRATPNGSLVVIPPVGRWDALRGSQGWAPADAGRLAAAGFPDAAAALARAQQLLPTPGAFLPPAAWFINGTVTVQEDGANFTLATAEPQMLFKRNATGFVIFEASHFLTWREEPRSIDASVGSLVHLEVLDPQVAEYRDVRWVDGRLDATLVVPPFRESDLRVSYQASSEAVEVQFEGVAKLSVFKHRNVTIEDNLVRIVGHNSTVQMVRR